MRRWVLKREMGRTSEPHQADIQQRVQRVALDVVPAAQQGLLRVAPRLRDRLCSGEQQR